MAAVAVEAVAVVEDDLSANMSLHCAGNGSAEARSGYNNGDEE